MALALHGTLLLKGTVQDTDLQGKRYKVDNKKSTTNDLDIQLFFKNMLKSEIHLCIQTWQKKKK